MKTKLEALDSTLFTALDEKQSGTLVGADMQKPTYKATGTWSSGGGWDADGEIASDF